MEISSSSRQGRHLAMMIRISGSDPKGRKMRQHAFFQSRNGITTLSASGFSLSSPPFPDDLLAITDASLVEPFIRQPDVRTTQVFPPSESLPSPFGPVSRTSRSKRTASLSTFGTNDQTEALLPGTKIEALFEEESGVTGWKEAELLALRDVPGASAALASLLGSHASIDSGGWELGWHLVSTEKSPLERPAVTSTPPSIKAPMSTFSDVRGPLESRPTFRPDREGQALSLQPQDAPSWVSTVEGRNNESAQSLVRIAILRIRLSSGGQAASKQQAEKAAGSQLESCINNPSSLELGSVKLGMSRLSSPSEGASRSADGAPAVPHLDARFECSPSGQAALASAGPLERGVVVTAVGSPFGALAAGHFANSVSVGVVSNWWKAGQNRAPVLLLDMRCLPGMEGGPVLDRSGGVVGMLWRPIRQRNSGAEVQLMITSDALVPVLRPFGVELLHCGRSSGHMSSSSSFQNDRESSAASTPSRLPRPFDATSFERAQEGQLLLAERSSSEASSSSSSKELDSFASQSNPRKAVDIPFSPSQAPDVRSFYTSNGVTQAVGKAGPSVVTLAVDDGAWASGIVLSTTGFILTNAHLIEPWRFTAKSKVQGSSMHTLARTMEPFARKDGGVTSGLGLVATSEEANLPGKTPIAALLERPEGKGRQTDDILVGAQRCRYMSSRSTDPGSTWTQDNLGQHVLQARTKLSSSEEVDTASQRSCNFVDTCRVRLVSDAKHAERGPLHNTGIEGRIPSNIAYLSQSAHTAQNEPASSSLLLIPAASNTPQRYSLVRVRLSESGAATWHSAHVIFVSQGPLDVAILQLLDAPADLQPIVPADHVPSPGATAAVIGHGLFGPLNELRPSVYCGVVSKLLKANGRPAMLQTTAAVHPGGSGGAVVDARGRLIGLVTSAARHSGGSMLPHLNFSIPVEALRPVFDFVEAGGLNVSLLEPLNEADSNASALWALAPPPPLPRPSQLLPGHPLQNLPQQDESQHGPKKGTRFAQFLNERGQELLKSKSLRSRL